MSTFQNKRVKRGRDFLDLDQIEGGELRSILKLASRMKKKPLAFRPMEGKTLALIFEKPSTRTRVSFEVGMRQLGGHVTTLSGAEIQLGRGETLHLQAARRITVGVGLSG